MTTAHLPGISPVGAAAGASGTLADRRNESARPHGKFFRVGAHKEFVRGVTYGPFRPTGDGPLLPAREQVRRDFGQMAGAGFNSVRVYTSPPRWALDEAAEAGLRVMVGIPWVENVAFLSDRALLRDCVQRVRDTVETCAGHPAVLCYAVGNEIPAHVVRWHGHRRIERHIERLCDMVRQRDPQALVTYVNYPSTEYLDLPFLDIVAFNVYLERPEQLRSYLARLQNIACERPLLLAEIGLDSLRNGHEKQAESVAWQVREALAGGCAGAFAFSWTDEWYRDGHDITDWCFGLTDAQRKPKPALAAVSAAFAEAPNLRPGELPMASVVVCTYNGGRTIRDCMTALSELDYPNYEVIVVDDGSKDNAAAIASEFPVRLIRTENRGLSSARNTGLAAARGEIVAYIDDDAYPDPHWLQHMARTLVDGGFGGVGGPNLHVPSDGWVAECVSHAPGGPTHVLLSDTVAEHIPGCNMAFWKNALEVIGGFDVQYRIAGDDVDACWKLQALGLNLGFSPAAMVWHHRRNRVGAFWRQQLNYGRAEAALERKWPDKYNAVGHPTWEGRLYGRGAHQRLFRSWRRIYHGVWGSALFQHVYHSQASLLWSLPTMPEWFVFKLLLLAVTLLGLIWPVLLWAGPVLAGALSIDLMYAAVHAGRATVDRRGRGRAMMLKIRLLIAYLWLIQPIARLLGRMDYGLTPWRLRGVAGFAWPGARAINLWCGKWRTHAERLHMLETRMRSAGVVVARGDAFGRWDLRVRGGFFGGVHLRQLTEDLKDGAQLVRLDAWPTCSRLGTLLILFCSAVALGLAWDGQALASAAVGSVVFLIGFTLVRECGAAMATLARHAKATEEK